MKKTSSLKVLGIALSLILAASALSSVATAQNSDRQSRTDAEELMREAERMAQHARELFAIAEEHGSHTAMAEIEAALKLIKEAKIMIEHEELERAKAALGEAWNHLVKAEKLLSTDKERDRRYEEEVEHDDIKTEAKHMMERAMQLQSIAKEQEDERALELLKKAMHLIERTVEVASDGDREEAIAMLAEAAELLKEVHAMLSKTPVPPSTTSIPTSSDDMKERMAVKAKHLMERAEHLNSIAEEQGNEKAMEVISKVMRMLEEVVEIASSSEADMKEAAAMLHEATKMLNRVAAELAGPDTDTRKRPYENSHDPAKFLARIAEELGHKGKRILPIAEEQENREAYAEAEIALELVADAWRHIEDDNHDDARAKLREASDHLSKASQMLQPDKVVRAEKSVRYIRDRAAVADVAGDIFEIRFGLDGKGYGILKNPDPVGKLYSTEISMQGTALEESRSGFHFVVNDVTITASALAPAITAAGDEARFVELTSVDAWDGKARKAGVVFVTSGIVEDTEGKTYRVKLRGLLLDASNQGLVYKVDGRIHLADRSGPEDANYLFANIHYLAIVNTTAA